MFIIVNFNTSSPEHIFTRVVYTLVFIVNFLFRVTPTIKVGRINTTNIPNVKHKPGPNSR